jgi:hypothetical protein
LRGSDLHQPIPPALLCGFDHGAAEAVNGVVGGLCDGPIRNKRDECRDTKLGQLFYEPLLTVTFRERDADGERKRQFAIDFATVDDSQLGISTP